MHQAMQLPKHCENHNSKCKKPHSSKLTFFDTFHPLLSSCTNHLYVAAVQPGMMLTPLYLRYVKTLLILKGPGAKLLSGAVAILEGRLQHCRAGRGLLGLSITLGNESVECISNICECGSFAWLCGPALLHDAAPSRITVLWLAWPQRAVHHALSARLHCS